MLIFFPRLSVAGNPPQANVSAEVGQDFSPPSAGAPPAEEKQWFPIRWATLIHFREGRIARHVVIFYVI